MLDFDKHFFSNIFLELPLLKRYHQDSQVVLGHTGVNGLFRIVLKKSTLDL